MTTNVNQKSQTIGVFFGSKNPEHDISIITSQLILAGLKELELNAVPVYIAKDGGWHIGDELGSIEFFKQKDKNLSRTTGWQIDTTASTGKLIFRKGLFKKIVTDLAFPAFHGQNGEDGTIQGLFELFDIPYVGCDVPSSSMTMDKVVTKLMYLQAGIPTTPFVHFFKHDWQERKDALVADIHKVLSWPMFVKPARLGSSIGIGRASNDGELIRAIEVALHYDEKVLVEQGIANLMDITCAVLGNDDPQPSLLQESIFGDGFFSYEDKYLKGGGAQLGKAQESIIIPARLDERATEAIRETAVRVFNLFGCSGISRVDFLYDTQKRIAYANEVNTLPGTLYHHLWAKSGVPLGKLLTELIRLAKERHARRGRLVHTFDSDILAQAQGWSKKLQSNKLQTSADQNNVKTL